MSFLAALPHLTTGGRHAFRLIASSVRTDFAEERGEVDFSPPLAQFGSTHAARLLHACAKGTSQIAHRKSLPVRMNFCYVQFGTSLSHIKGRCIHWRASARSARSALGPGVAGFGDAAGCGLLRGCAACAGGLRPPRGNAAALCAAALLGARRGGRPGHRPAAFGRCDAAKGSGHIAACGRIRRQAMPARRGVRGRTGPSLRRRLPPTSPC